VLDRASAHLLGGDARGGQAHRGLDGHLVGADRDHRHVLRHGPALLAQQGEPGVDGGLVLHDEARGAGALVEDPGQRRRHRVVAALAGAVQRPQAQLAGAGAQTVEGAFGEAGVPLVDGGRLADDSDVTVPEHRQVLQAERARRAPVQVDAGQTGGVGGQADQDGRLVSRTQQRQPLVVQFDVHQDHGVGESAAGDPADGVWPLLAGEQQDVVAVEPCRGGHGDGDLHHHRYVHVGAQRDHQGDDVRPAARQGAGARVRVVAEHPDALLDPPPGARGDGPLAAEDVAHRARRDSGVLGDLGEGDHPALPAL
jgi:hypothetical protein